MNEDKYSSVGWHSVVFSVAESPVDIEKEEWKSKHNVEKLNFEIELEQPTVLGGIKIGYDGASFINIESKETDIEEWQILVPKTTLRPFLDISSGHDEKFRSKSFPVTSFTKSLRSKKLQYLKFNLEQPFSPSCPIGFNFITLFDDESMLEEKESSIKGVDIVSMMTDTPSSKKTQKTSNSLKLLLNNSIIVEKIIGAEDIIAKIKEMGGKVLYSLPGILNTDRYIVLEDLCSSNKYPFSVHLVNSKWVTDCYKQQKRLPLLEYKKEKKEEKKEPSVDYNTVFNDDSEDEGDIMSSSPDIPTQEHSLSFDDKIDEFPEDIELTDLELPNFLKGHTIGIVDEIPVEEQGFLSRYVIAYGGEVVEQWKEMPITHLLRNESPAWTKEFHEEISNHSFGNFAIVQPEWIISCHNNQKLVPENEYLCIG